MWEVVSTTIAIVCVQVTATIDGIAGYSVMASTDQNGVCVWGGGGTRPCHGCIVHFSTAWLRLHFWLARAPHACA